MKPEREKFFNERDKNGDGKLTKSELGDWVAPDGAHYEEDEAKHLIKEADTNKVTYLLVLNVSLKLECLDKY